MGDRVPGMAEAIERRRKAEGLSPGDFAKRVGVTLQGLSPVRDGKRKRYSDKIRFGVARALRWPTDWYDRLLDGEDSNAFEDVDHPEAPASTEERLSALEREVRSLAAELRGDEQ